MNPSDFFEFNDEYSFEGVPCLLNTQVPLPPLPFQPSAQNVSSSDPSFAHSSQYSEKSSDSDSVVSLSPTCEATSFQAMPAFQLKPCQQEQHHHQQQHFTPPASPTPQRDDVDYKTLYFAAQEHIQALSHTVHELELKVAELQSCVGTPASSPESIPRSRASSSSSHHLSVNLSDSVNSPTSSEEFSPEAPRRCFMSSQELPCYHAQQQQQQQQQQCAATAQQFHARASPEPAQLQQQQVQQQSAAFSLEFIPNIPAVWYADRPLPSIKIRAHGIEGVANPTDFRVQISMIDGLGEDASDKLGGPASSHSFLFPVQSDCEAELTGMRFSAVSSKWGGHFKVVAKLVGPPQFLGATTPAVQVFSDRIQVLSYRLYNSPKVDFAKLSGKDSLSKIKGIGSLYAKRFAHLGIKTVADLAALGDSGNEFDQTLDHLRKERGALTKAKFTDYINQAREIVSRELKEQGQPLMAPVPQPQSESPSSKKRSLFSDCSPQSAAATPSPRNLVHHDLLMGGGPSSLGMSLAMAANQMDPAKRPRTADALWFPAN